MKLFLIIALLLTLVGCGKEEDKGKCCFVKTYKAYGTFTGKRAFLAHGNQGHSSDYLKAAGLRRLFDGLIGKGYQVILFDYPDTRVSNFMEGSRVYRELYADFVDWMIRDAEARHGVATERLFGGVSLGGLHTFMAVALNPMIDRWIAVLPVVDITALREFRSVNSTHFSALNEVAAIAAKPGYIIYGTQDFRVDYRLTERLAQELWSAGANLTLEQVVGHGHTFNTDIADRTLIWVN